MLKFCTSVLLISSLLITGCFFKQKEKVSTMFMMDTLISITVNGDDEKALDSASADAFTAFKAVADATNPYENHLPDDLFMLNKNAGKGSFKVNPTVFTLLSSAQKLNHPEVDLTLGDVIKIWQSHSKTKTVPSKEEIAQALPNAKAHSFTLNTKDKTVTLAPKAQLDLGSIAKGYAVDAAAKVLQKNKKVTSALINAGGNIMVLGTKPDGKRWKIGLQDPRDAQKLVGTLELPPDMAIATSGDYQRYYEVQGVRYHHILDPRTGFPARGTISATAVTTSAFLADYYSTLLFVLPLNKAKALVEKTPNLEAIIKTSAQELYISPGLQGKFHVKA